MIETDGRGRSRRAIEDEHRLLDSRNRTLGEVLEELVELEADEVEIILEEAFNEDVEVRGEKLRALEKLLDRVLNEEVDLESDELEVLSKEVQFEAGDLRALNQVLDDINEEVDFNSKEIRNRIKNQEDGGT